MPRETDKIHQPLAIISRRLVSLSHLQKFVCGVNRLETFEQVSSIRVFFVVIAVYNNAIQRLLRVRAHVLLNYLGHGKGSNGGD
jgi:hypothetical protein